MKNILSPNLNTVNILPRIFFPKPLFVYGVKKNHFPKNWVIIFVFVELFFQGELFLGLGGIGITACLESYVLNSIHIF